MLQEAISDYLLWMISTGYSESTWEHTERALRCFSTFVKERNITRNVIFTLDTLHAYQEKRGHTYTYAVKGLWQYLYEKGRISQPLQREKPRLPDVYEQYILYYSKLKHPHNYSLLILRRVLSAFNDYLEKKRICLSKLRIEDIDTFLIEYNRPYALQTQGGHRSYLRGFLRYLYQIRGIVHKDFAPLLVGAPVYAQTKPPKFLRPQEVQRVFAGLKLSSARGLRSYAMLLFIFTLGLRPKEISLISLDDIFFSKGQVSIKDRKATNPIMLPLPDITIKAIAAYIVGARPKTAQRTLFLCHRAPYRPISPPAVSMDIKSCMRKANLTSSAYWLRHTYAQNLLERGTSIFEIKEMMGHDRIQTSQCYIHIHTKLMREVLFNETL